MYFIISFLFSIIWSLLWFWYDHPFLFGLFGCLAFVGKKALVLGDEKALGQPNSARKQSKIKKEDITEPQVLIVGAGAAGLAMAACLQKEGVSFIAIDSSDAIGDSWRRRYDRLHLHTTRSGSSLPYVPLPDSLPLYPSRDDVVNYLEGYAVILGLTKHILLQHTATYDESQKKWNVVVQSNAGKNFVFQPKQLVVASGENTNPNIPQFEGQSTFKGKIFHSSEYKNGQEFAEKKVLVVGFGNSGAEMAVDLWEHDAYPTVLVRSPQNIVYRKDQWLTGEILQNIGARLLPLWVLDAIGVIIIKNGFSDLKNYGITVPRNATPISDLVLTHHPPNIDVGCADLIRKGYVKVVTSEIEKLNETKVHFKDGKVLEFDAILLATGYQFNASYSKFLDESVVKKVIGPHHVVDSGRESPQENLYFIGYNDLFGRFKEISLEAVRIARHIAAFKTENFAT